jgi:arylsulfatase A-like enzyme
VQLFYNNRRYNEITEEDVRRARASYLGLATYIDDQVGRVLAALRESGREDDTIVVFTSDHGACVGEHGWMEKWAQLWEETCRVPLLVAVPEGAAGTCGALVQQIDLAPALLELCGVPVPETMQGRSLVPLLTDPSREFRDAVFAETFIPALMTEPACSVRTREWKLTDYPRMADIESRLPVDHPRRMHPMFSPERLIEGELYDLRSDPYETTNLLGSPGRSKIEATLRARLDVWKRECEPTVDWSALRPPDGFAWSQQRMIEGATTRRLATVWGLPTQATRLGTPARASARADT